MKARYNQALDLLFYFFRDVTGREGDLLLQQGSRLLPIEIKSSKTFSPAFLEALKYFHQQTGKKALGGAVIYGGDQTQRLGEYTLYNPENCSQLISDKFSTS
jgi:hypothetical protein